MMREKVLDHLYQLGNECLGFVWLKHCSWNLTVVSRG